MRSVVDRCAPGGDMRDVRTRVIVAVLVGWGAATGPATAAASAPGDVVTTFADAAGRTVVLREGNYDGFNGFGWEKIRVRHKITNVDVVKAIIGNPDGGTPDKQV